MNMNLRDLLSEQTIDLTLTAQNREDAIRKMAALLEQTGAVTDSADYVQKVLDREQTGSTGIGFGVSIPHGKSKGVSRPGLAFARLEQPLEWEAMDDKPVDTVFLIAVPEEKAGDEHLKILSSLSRKLIHEDFRQQLRDASTPAELLDVLDAS
jgi:fructose PTS system EIIA component